MDAALKFRATASHLASPRESLRERCFRTMFETAPIGLAVCRLDGQIVEANAALARLLGYERTETTGIKLLTPGWLDGLLRGERETFAAESGWQQRDGPQFWGRLSATLARNARGQPESLLVVLEDVSKRREMEEHLRQAEKMEAIGRLAGGVAHDFNNLLTGILLYSDLLLAELEPENAPHRYVNEVRLACEQGAALTHQLLSVARKSGSGRQAAGINEVVAGTENLLRRLIGEQIELITSLDAAADSVMADAGSVRQILLNLALNARDALGRGKVWGGKIRISTRIADVPGGGSNGDPRPRACLLTVEDTGCGMSAEIRSHLFEPFFTTKKDGEGTGLGLGTVQRIVRELGGKIEVASAPGSGTRIEVFLPAAKEEESGGHCPPGQMRPFVMLRTRKVQSILRF